MTFSFFNYICLISTMHIDQHVSKKRLAKYLKPKHFLYCIKNQKDCVTHKMKDKKRKESTTHSLCPVGLLNGLCV